MGLFRRKKKEQATPIEVPALPHEHTWKDMPWYMDVRYNGENRTAGYQIIEPYICVVCGKRENKILEQEDWSNISVEVREKTYSKIRNKYKKYLKPRAVVEDMINNILMVKDPEYLDMVETMRGLPHRRCGTSAEMKQITDEKHYRIEVPKNEMDSRKIGRK